MTSPANKQPSMAEVFDKAYPTQGPAQGMTPPTVGKMTPGKWKVRIDGTNSGQWPTVYVEDIRFEGGMRDIADLETILVKRSDRWKDTPERFEAEANARSIALVPELVETLRAWQLWLELEATQDPQGRIRLLESAGDFQSGWQDRWQGVLDEYKTKAALSAERLLATLEGRPNV